MIELKNYICKDRKLDDEMKFKENEENSNSSDVYAMRLGRELVTHEDYYWGVHNRDSSLFFKNHLTLPRVGQQR